ncbi:Gfo/Idh/MocA family protein [Paenarthrobacter ureafaciens]|uniref:Gfo/Idh/MocA family protein n=1 Tax=Paenarthrobacter ureafaciens TaxID=37931 RepID=UPI00140734AE|nr:Gfo/Idh/MocA family oxidoreductase [Paenarthrobacter ureafaciens]MCX8456287.1 Gfo/Idh/MocA family oxidoreductase [Paenarthrobacter ureafaciens]MCY0972293.1 Gfo/Idh/MocA family oxidoreductase [Paenarthrobacter ureafaciens]QQQ63220.1 Gfo/Idh/MocA family oxidoreductase [Paenarthrobacter ureafaciens]
MKTYRVAIVGTGGIAAVHAANLARTDGRAQLVAACDVDEARLQGFTAEHGIAAGFQSLSELLAEAKPDIVHLCTPPMLHIDQAIECLEAGAHVLSEKPPALSLADFDRLNTAGKANGAQFSCVFQHRFGDASAAARKLIGGSDFGRPLVARCDTLWYRPDNYFDLPWRGTWKAEGGGPTMGHGIHQFDLLLHLLGPWEEVVAIAARQARATSTEDLSAALVRFENGATATVINSLLSPRETSEIRIDCEFATVELTHLYGYSTSNWTVTPAPNHESFVAEAWKAEPLERGSGHSAQFLAMYDALDAGRPLPADAESSRQTLEFAAAIYASAFTGQAVRRGEIVPGHPFYGGMDGDGLGTRVLASTARA